MLRFTIVTVLLLSGCGDDRGPTPADVRFDPRDAVIDPRDALSVDSAADAGDVSAVVDVMVFDLADSATMPGRDARADAPMDATVLADVAQPDERPASQCTELAEQFAATVRQASVCGADLECTASVCETLCCVCQVYVSVADGGVSRLNELRARAEALNCSTMIGCSSSACDPPRAALCSSAGRCVTLRAPSDGGLDP